MKPQDKRLVAYVSKEQYQKLKKKSDETGIAISAMLKTAIVKELN